MGTSEDGRRQQAWSAYWTSGRLHSCAGSYAGNYDGAIGRFWRGVFAALPERARVLDLATGNGPLPLLLWEQRGADAQLKIDAVDLAQVAPPWFDPATHADIRFHSGIAMEALPFADASVDLVISQYGFEYADREGAVAELLRVVAPSAGIALVLHHAGSVLARVARSERANVQRLLAADGLPARARALVPWLAQARAGHPPRGLAAADRDREAYNRAMQALAATIAGGEAAPDLLVEAREHVHRLLAAVGSDPAPTLAALDDYEAALRTAELRSAELLEHALDDAEIAALAARLAADRPETRIEVDVLQQAEGVLAWSLWQRPAAAAA